MNNNEQSLQLLEQTIIKIHLYDDHINIDLKRSREYSQNMNPFGYAVAFDFACNEYTRKQKELKALSVILKETNERTDYTQEEQFTLNVLNKRATELLQQANELKKLYGDITSILEEMSST